jgi:hypothetical protein
METPTWNRTPEHLLLQKKISDLGLQVEGSGIEPLIEKLYEELRKKKLSFLPTCFLADEWFCPVGIPAIGIPFYLANRRLRRLEKKTMLEAEGDTKTEFMKLIRHEAGHAYSYAYGLYKKKKWQKLFGLASTDYPDTYQPKPYSRSFVVHLDNWYAQSHPDEDFAETFAVWLTPQSHWQKKYRNWKAMEKLEYVDELMSSLAGQEPLHNPSFRVKDVDCLKIKLKTYYERKRKLFAEDFPDFYDRDLFKLFTDEKEIRGKQKAYQYLQQNREILIRSAALWTNEKRYTVSDLLNNLIARCKELNLYLKTDDNKIDFQVSAYITTLINTYLFTGKFKRSK